MPAVIVLNDGGETSVHVSDLTMRETADRIAGRFEGFSTDDETTTVVPGCDDEFTGEFLTVVLTNKNADDGSGPDFDLAHVLEFSPEAVRWALSRTDAGWGENERLREAGVLS